MARYYSFISVIIAVLASLLFASCQNNGDIGDLYGQWQLVQMSDGSQTSTPDGFYISFQSTTMWVKSVNETDHLYTDCFGRYEQRGDSLFVNFSNTNEIKTVEMLVNHRLHFSDTSEARLALTLSDKALLLTSGQRQWQFIKY